MFNLHLKESKRAPAHPVRDLSNFTQINQWTVPVYDFTSEQGPPHTKEYVCSVNLDKLSAQGIGKSKKIAKRYAAENMLTLLKYGTVRPGTAMDKSRDNRPLTVSEQISQFFHELKSSTHLAQLQGKTLQPGEMNYRMILHNIGEEQGFGVDYKAIPPISKPGIYACCVELTIKGTTLIVHNGCGGSYAAANNAASMNMLIRFQKETMK